MHSRIPKALLLSLVACGPRQVMAQVTLTAQTRAADSVLAAYAKPNAPGCAVGAYEGGKTLYESAFGLANLEHSIPIDPSRSVFNVGSVTKQFTAFRDDYLRVHEIVDRRKKVKKKAAGKKK